MIPQAFITEWANQVPWQTNEQVEQDLVICRALAAIFSDDFLANRLAFRGGTALHKLYLSPPAHATLLHTNWKNCWPQNCGRCINAEKAVIYSIYTRH